MQSLQKSATETFDSSSLGTLIFFGHNQENETNLFAVTRSDQSAENFAVPLVKESQPRHNFLQTATTMAVTFLSEQERGSLLENQSLEMESVISLGPMGDLLDSTNGTADLAMYWPIRDPLYITIPITVVYVIILVLGLLGNVVTCIVIIRSRYLHTTTNYYLFSLAISDLLLLLSGLPAEMHSIWWRYPYVFGEMFCVGRGLAAETSSNATVLTITAFTIERYLAICRPFMIQKWQNKLSRVVRQILLIWIIAIALAVPQALQFGLDTINVGPNKTSVTCGVKKVLIEHSFEIATFVFFVAPMILITALYCLIGFTLRNASRVKESKLRLRKSLSGHKREVGQQRVLKMLVAVVVGFFICWFPFHTQRLMAIWGAKYLEQNETLRTTYHILTYISGILYYVSTCINPILYSVLSLKFRHAFQENVNKCCGEQTSRKPRTEILVTVNNHQQRSYSHSHSSRSQQNMALTEVTTFSNLTGNFMQQIHHHSSSNSHQHQHQHQQQHLSFCCTKFMDHEVGVDDAVCEV